MTDFILNVRRGAHQSFEIEVYQEDGVTLQDVSAATTSVIVSFSPLNGAVATISKTCRKVVPAQGLVSLDLNPAESRAFLGRMDAEVELRTFQREDIVAYGRVYAKGGINTDV